MEHKSLRFFSASSGALTLIVTIATAACHAHPPTPGAKASIAVLKVSCDVRDDELDCRALGQVAGSPFDPSEDVDVTDTVTWTTSNARTADVVRGQVTSKEPGSATIAATLRSGDETVTSAVLVVVGDDGARPQVAYDLNGVVRDTSNTAVTDVELTLADGRGGTRVAVTAQNSGHPDGTFRFVPVLRGQYRLRATKPGYRPVERVVSVPDTAPLTLVMLSEPR